MNIETYLNHPTFGLLYRVCIFEDNQELFTTLYAQRLYFSVTVGTDNLIFDPISRSNARLIVENRLRQFRRNGLLEEYEALNAIYKRTFQ